MRKKELIVALKKIEAGFSEAISILEKEEDTTAPVAKKAEKKEEKVPEKKETTAESQFTEEELNAMKYNDLKKLGKELGVKCVGTREEITARILEVPADGSIMNEPEPEEKDDKVVPITKSTKKSAKKKEEPVEVQDDIEEKYLSLAREALEDNSLEEVAEVLEEAGVKLTKAMRKKADVIMTKLAEAFQKGLIEAEDDEDDEDEEADSSSDETADDSFEFSEDSYFEQYDPEGINHPDNMTKKRAKAVKALVADIINQYEEDELDLEEVEDYLGDVVTDDDLELLGEEYTEDELVAFYIEMKKRFIDDDGAECEPSEPYEISGENFCCGHELVYSKKGNKYTCPVCEEEYEAE